jgi:Cu(I)/Ag(I) efflux system membrane protein CusA/SilA
MVGGLVTSFIMELLVYPPIYFLWRKRQLQAATRTPSLVPPVEAAVQ